MSCDNKDNHNSLNSWILAISAALIVGGIGTSIKMQFTQNERLAIIETVIETKIGDNDPKAQHSKHWQYDSKLRDSLNEVRTKVGLDPMPSPIFHSPDNE